MINTNDIIKAIKNHFEATKCLHKDELHTNSSYNKLININADNLVLISYNKHEKGCVAILRDIKDSIIFKVEFYHISNENIIRVSSYEEIRKDQFNYKKD